MLRSCGLAAGPHSPQHASEDDRRRGAMPLRQIAVQRGEHAGGVCIGSSASHQVAAAAETQGHNQRLREVTRKVAAQKSSTAA